MKKQKTAKLVVWLFLLLMVIPFLADNTVFAAGSTENTNLTKSYIGGYIDSVDVFKSSLTIDGVKYSTSNDLDFSEATAFWVDGKYVVAILINNKITKLYETDEPDKSAASSQLKSLVEDVAYGVPIYKQTKEGAIVSVAQDLENAINTYLEKLGIVLSKEANSSEIGDTAERLRAIDEVTNDKMITMVNGTPNAVIDAVYVVYAMYLDTCVDVGVDLGKIDFSKSTVEISTKLVNKIQNSMIDDVFTAKTGKYTVTFNITGIWGANTGSITVSTEKNTYIGIINTNTTKTAKIMSKYINELSDLAKSGYKKAVLSLVSYFSKTTGIGEFATKEWKKLFKGITTTLQQNNHGNIPKNVVKMSELYESIKTLKNNKTADDVKKTFKEIANIYKKIKDTSDYTDNEVCDKATTIALKQVNRIKDNLVTEIYNYLYDPTNSVVVSKESLWTKMKKLIFQCPVDIEVYDFNGTLIGSTANGEDSFDDNLIAEINGDVKTIYLPDDINVTIKMIAIDDGEMDYVVEQIENGARISRLNYYDVALSKGESYTQKLSVSSIPTNTSSLPLETSSGEKVYASEYLSANTVAVVKVSCSADTGGMVYGDSVYAKGSPVELSANATDENFIFAGWYINDKLVELKNTYRFCAKENVSIRAAFEEKRVKDENCVITIGKKYENFAGTNIYINNSNSSLRDIVIGLDGVDANPSDFATVTVKKYSQDKNLINSEVKSTIYDGNFNFWLTLLNLENCAKMEILDSSENIIVTIDFLNTDVPIATVITWYEVPNGYSLSADIYIGDDPNCSFSCLVKDGSDIVVLFRYLGSTDNIYVPGRLQIKDKVYNVYLEENVFFTGVFNNYATVDNVTKVIFSEINGQKVELGSDEHGLFEQYFNALTEVDLSGLNTSFTTSMQSMFANCSSLVSLDVSTLDTSNVANMEDMFAGCSSLISLDISEFNMSNVTNMDGMFWRCKNLQTVLLGNLNTSKVTNMHAMFSDCSSLNTLDLGGLNTSNVTDLSTMFSGCNSLENLDLSGLDTRKVENLSYMFGGCNNLRTINFSGWNTSNVKNWFTLNDCKNLVDLDLSSFEINVNVTINISTPNTFVTPKYMTDGCCLKMEDLYCNENKNRYYRDFVANDGTQITFYRMPDGDHIAKGAIRQHSGVFGNDHKVAWIYDSTKTLTIFGDGSMEDYDVDYHVPYTYVDYHNGNDNACVVDEDDLYEKVTIEEGVTRIGNHAFCSARNLIDIEIPTSVKSIGEYAFSGMNGSWNYGCSLSSIIIPSSVISLGRGVFYDCVNLKSVTLSENLNSIPDYAFCECESIEAITIPNSIKQIGEYAFMNCKNLTNIEIPDSVTEIGDCAFKDCSNNLIIYGKKSSYAQQYANEHNIEFREITDKDDNKSDEDKPSDNNGNAEDNNNDYIEEDNSYMPDDDTVNNQETTDNNNGNTGNNQGTTDNNNGNTGNNQSTVDNNNGNTGNNQSTVDNNNGSTGNNQGTTNNNNTTSKDKKILCYITYKLKSGKNNPKNLNFYEQGENVQLQPAHRKGYKFVGWYTDKSCKNKVSNIVIKKDTTLYVKWKKIVVKTPKIKTLKALGNKELKISFKKDKTLDGYQIVYSKNMKFKNKQTLLINNKTTCKLSNFTGKYAIKVRGYILDSAGKKVYSKYTKAKKINIK